jgi:hypothetical protein
MSGANLVPTKGIQVITSEKDRHLIVLGADPIIGSARSGTIDPMLIAFSDQENDLQFEPLITNTAGSLRLSSGSSIIGAVISLDKRYWFGLMLLCIACSLLDRLLLLLLT